MSDLKPPSSVRTPGRTWTEFPEVPEETGEGSVSVEAPDGIEVREARGEELFRQVVEDNTVTERHEAALDTENTVFIRVPQGAAVEEPVRITSEVAEGFFPHHVVVEVGDGASVTVVEENHGEGGLDTSIVEARVGKDATLAYEKINALGDVTGYADSHVTVAENGEVGWLFTSTGAAMYRNAVETRLEGPRSSLDYRLAFLASGEQHMDHSSTVVHAADNTRCDMDSRGVALDSSRTVYRGVQEVEENAEGTKSFQDEKTVLVGDEAEADTTPQLRIDNNEVEATHAATTGHVDEEDLFYMMSRGLKDGQAKKEIIRGMFDDLVDSAAARDVVHAKIQESLA